MGAVWHERKISGASKGLMGLGAGIGTGCGVDTNVHGLEEVSCNSSSKK
jgi:hypothetical protein